MRFVRCVTAAAMLAVCGFAPVVSAQSNPTVTHYRAYVAAMERGDLVAATTEGEAALEASEARDGDGGRTAVLAMNLANVHLLADRAAQAKPLAERAMRLARGGAQGVNPAAAEVLFLRASLAVDPNGHGAADVARQLSTLLASSAAESIEDETFYWAGAEIGNWGLRHAEFELGQSGWAMAGAHAAGSPFGEVYGLGRARTSEGIAVVMAELDEARGRRIDEDGSHEAYALLGEATRLLYPLAQVETPTLELTLAQQTYAEARVWLLALGAKLLADGRDLPTLPAEAQGDDDGFSEIGPVDLSRPRCMMRVVAEPPPRYPSNSQVGAVILFLRVNAEGQIVSQQVAARAGSEQFADSVERVAGRWRVERLETSAPNCRMEANMLQAIRFQMHN